MRPMWLLGNLAILIAAAILLVGSGVIASAQEAEPVEAAAEAMDATAGEGLTAGFSVEAVIDDLTRKFEAGGLTMWFLLFLSILSLAFILERAFRLRKRKIVPTGFADKADQLWKAGDREGLFALCDRYRRATLSKVVRFLATHEKGSLTDVNNVAGDIASRDIGYHQMLTYPLAAIGTLAPLLGLFGTVLGMIESFETVAIAGNMGDPSLLAGGISMALVTTAFGLFVAIPTLFFYNIFRFRTNFLAKLLEEQVTGLVHEWMMTKEVR